MLQQKIRSFHILIVGLLAASVLVTGCDLGSSGTSTGTMEVRLHDAPADYSAVNVFIDSVQVNREGSADGWITISEPNQSYNLLELNNGNYEVLGLAELEAGTYHQIRLILSREGHNVVVDGQEEAMFVPSGTETGVKLQVNAEVEEGTTIVLMLDFDASRSVVKGNQNNPMGEYLLQPVIRATNQAEAGDIEGTVSPAEARSVVYALAGSDTLSSTYADTTSGYFKLLGLEEGSYTISIEPRNTDYQSAEVAGVEVTVGETNDLGEQELGQN